MIAPTLLRVVEALPDENGPGSARLDAQTSERLEVRLGDVVEIRGGRLTLAVVSRARPVDEGEGLIRVAAVLRGNAGVDYGDRVIVCRADCTSAESITLVPIPMICSRFRRPSRGVELEEILAKSLLRRPFVREDVVDVPGVEVPFMVESTRPEGAVQVTPRTRITINQAPS